MDNRTFILKPAPPCPIRGLRPGKPEQVTVTTAGIVTMRRALGAWRISRVDYAGPRVVKQVVTEQRGETRRKGRVLGAVAGSIVAGGVGAAIGAGVGTGNKKHMSTTVSTEHEVEEPSALTAWLVDLESGASVAVGFVGFYAELAPFAGWCDYVLKNRMGAGPIPVAQRIAPRAIPQALPVSRAAEHADPYEEVAKLKRLLDMGAVTQDEFERKKRDLLGL